MPAIYRGGALTVLVVGLVLFLGIHSVALVGQRDRAVAALGEGPWKGLYSLVALVGMAAMVVGYGQARATAPVVVWVPPAWASHVTATLLLPLFPLLLAAYLPGRIQQRLKHPMLVATKLWALAHLVANGMLHDLLLFGGLLAWAVAVRVSLKRRPPRAIAMAPAGPLNDALAIGLGLALYAAFVAGLHRVLIGVSPLPALAG